MREIQSPLKGIPSPVSKVKGRYSVSGLRPAFVLDFQAEYYKGAS